MISPLHSAGGLTLYVLFLSVLVRTVASIARCVSSAVTGVG